MYIVIRSIIFKRQQFLNFSSTNIIYDNPKHFCGGQQ